MSSAYSQILPIDGVRTPMDDCPPYDPTMWGGKDCYFLSKLLAVSEVREELAERGWAGDLNPVVNGPSVFAGKSNTGRFNTVSRAIGDESFLAPEPPSTGERVRALSRAVMNLVGLGDSFASSSTAVAPIPAPNSRTGWFGGIRRVLWVLDRFRSPAYAGSSDATPIAVAPTDSLQERLDTALSVGDTLAASQIAIELARRRSTIRRQGQGGSENTMTHTLGSSAESNQVLDGRRGVTANFWS